MGLQYRTYLDSGEVVYGCCRCKTHLSTADAIISRQFNGQHGQAFLFDAVVNVTYGVPENRLMSSGQHKVRDIFCIKCSELLGWNYVSEWIGCSVIDYILIGESIRYVESIQRRQIHSRKEVVLWSTLASSTLLLYDRINCGLCWCHFSSLYFFIIFFLSPWIPYSKLLLTLFSEIVKKYASQESS